MHVRWHVVGREGGRLVEYVRPHSGWVAALKRHAGSVLLAGFGGYDVLYRRTGERVDVVAVRTLPDGNKEAMRFALLRPMGSCEWLGLPSADWMETP